jgi:hypothetical protein
MAGPSDDIKRLGQAVKAARGIDGLLTRADLRNFILEVLAQQRKRLAKLAGIDFGRTTLTYPGGSSLTTPLTIPHSLGVAPGAMFATDGSQPLNHLSMSSGTEDDFVIWAQRIDGAFPGAGTTITAYWLVLV